MKHPRLAALAALTLLAGCGEGAGQSRAQGAEHKVSLNEFVSAHRARLMKLDTNHDGRISRAEFDADIARKAAAATLRGEVVPPPDPARIDALWARLDLNHDGMLTPDEIDEAGKRLFKHLDANGDGVLTGDELAPLRRAGQSGGTGP